jgi:hypothetical protein
MVEPFVGSEEEDEEDEEDEEGEDDVGGEEAQPAAAVAPKRIVSNECFMRLTLQVDALPR